MSSVQPVSSYLQAQPRFFPTGNTSNPGYPPPAFPMGQLFPSKQPFLPVATSGKDTKLSVFIKNALELGAIVGASLAGNVLAGFWGSVGAGIVSSGFFSWRDQLATRGELNWPEWAIDAGTGLVPTGAGKLVHGSAHLLTAKFPVKSVHMLTKAKLVEKIITGMVDGAAMGYIGGLTETGLKQYYQSGKMDVAQANRTGLQIALPGALGGALLGACLAGVRRFKKSHWA